VIHAASHVCLSLACGVGPGPDDPKFAQISGDAKRRLNDLKAMRADAGFDGEGPASGAGSSSRAEVRAALAALGYQPEEVRRAVGELPADGDVGSLVRRALQTLGATR